MADFLARLRQRKLVQWALAYIAAAFALIQVADVVGQQFGWPDGMRRGITIALAVGFSLTLVLAWYHGEQGAQRFSGSELTIIALLLAIGGGTVWWLAPKADDASHPRSTAPAGAAADRKSIAVLPFANLSEDKGNAYFADGMRDMILTKLATIGDLKVISRTSTDKYASRPDDLKTVARELGVACVLEGSVQKAGNRVLINLQLISADDDQHLWAEAYQRTLEDIFGVEGEIAEIVAQTLNAKLSAAEQKSIAAKSTTDAQALDLFLRGEQLLHAGEQPAKPELVDEAVRRYESAVAIDPKFALAWARLSYARSWLYWREGAEATPLEDSARLAAEDAERAVALQPELAEANLAMGFYHYYVRLDLARALVSFDAALRAKPNDAPVLHALGLITRRLGRYDESIAHLKAANRLDPRNAAVSRSLRTTLIFARHYSGALQLTEQELALDPNDVEALTDAAFLKLFLNDDLQGADAYLKKSEAPVAQVDRTDLLRALGRYAEAIEVAKAIPDTLDNFSDHGSKSLVLGTLYLESGDADAARPLLLDARKKAEQAKAKVPDNHPAAAGERLNVAFIDALLGESDAAVESAQHALALPAVQPEKDHAGWVDAASWATRVYARAHRADLAVPLLEKLLASPGTGYGVAYEVLRLDADFAPIRQDPAFQALIEAHPGSGDVPE